jgi:Ca2+:H+ antiporter
MFGGKRPEEPMNDPQQQNPIAEYFNVGAAPLVGAASLLLISLLHEPLYTDLNNFAVTLPLFVGLFAVMMWCAFNVVRHADALAGILGEPYGTLVLTFSVIAIEVSLLASIMLTGAENPTLARDTMFATLMIVLNGMVGAALLLGALRYGEQEYSLEGARAFLVVITALSVFALIIPGIVQTEPDPSLSPVQAVMFATITILFYGVFVGIQTMRHRAYFMEPNHPAEAEAAHVHPHKPSGSATYHTVLLFSCLLPVVLLAHPLAVIVDHGIAEVGLPAPIGGVIIAILVLSPEGLTALHAARANQLQRAVNVCLGSALATIGLTIPAVLTVGLLFGLHVHLGLDAVEEVLLVLTLFVSALTFGGTRTNVLQGLVHLLLFVVFLVLVLSP